MTDDVHSECSFRIFEGPIQDRGGGCPASTCRRWVRWVQGPSTTKRSQFGRRGSGGHVEEKGSPHYRYECRPTRFFISMLSTLLMDEFKKASKPKERVQDRFPEVRALDHNFLTNVFPQVETGARLQSVEWCETTAHVHLRSHCTCCDM